MIKLPLRISPQVRYRPAMILDADGHVVDLEAVVGIVGALTMVLNAAKMAKRPVPLLPEDANLVYALEVADKVLGCPEHSPSA